MSRKLTQNVVLFLILFTCLLLISPPVIVSSAKIADTILPEPVDPEPYPFSDRYPAVVVVDSIDDLQRLHQLNIDIGGLRTIDGSPSTALNSFNPSIATIYVNPSQADQLARFGMESIPIANEGLRSFKAYGPDSEYPVPWPTFEEFVARMQGLTAMYPDLAAMVSIGKSVEGRDIWCLKISDQVSMNEDEPEFKYTSSIHGDETTGIELTIRLAELLLGNYDNETTPELTHLVDEIEIWLCPISNPDGYVAGSRYNANGLDLNRNFPDRFTDPIDNPEGHEPETQAFMNFGYGRRFVMGANYHGGEFVFNYPWDAVAAPGEEIVPDYAPDDTIFHDFGLGYTILNPMLYNNEEFEDGLTAGWDWYQIYGGMQDWAYWWRGEHHVTIEVSVIKTPKYDEIEPYWENNRAAMLWWMERVLSGVRGSVLDAQTGSPLDATITITELERPNFILTDPGVGDYHRVIAPGTYTLTASAIGYLSRSYVVEVGTGAATVQDFLLFKGPDLSSSTKEASAQQALPGDSLDYQIVVQNTGSATIATLTDTLPSSVTFLGQLTASKGLPSYSEGQILWQSPLDVGEAVTITYSTRINDCLAADWQFSNQVAIKDDLAVNTNLSATVSIQNQAPQPPTLLSPANGAVNQPRELVLSWSPSTDLNCDPLTYSVFLGTNDQPPLFIQGLSTTSYQLTALQPGTTYYWTVSADDGSIATIGPVWSFTTTQGYQLYLPLAVKINNQEP